MENKNLSTKESLEIIQSMIEKSSERYNSNYRFYFLLWGFLLISASVGHFLLLKIEKSEWITYLWLGIVFVGVLFSILKKGSQTKSYLDYYLSYVWKFQMLFFVLSPVVAIQNGMQNPMPIIMLAMGVFCIMTGFFLKNQLQLLGGIGTIFISLITQWISQEVLILYFALSVFLCYVFPFLITNKQNGK
ncbi:MAG: hypothetical protein H6604_07385 [Flavobacteriales bacterium]|nr:hypothetical protein [Flavobacteriales bacterium]